MPKLVSDELLKECNHHLKASAVTENVKGTEEWKAVSVFGTNAEKIGELTRSVGVRLYFDYMKLMGITFFIIFWLMMPSMVFNLKGNMVESSNALEAALGGTTVANIGLCPAGGCRSSEELFERCAWDKDCLDKPLEEQVKIKDVTQWLGLLDGVGIAVFMIFNAVYLIVRLPKIVDAQDKAVVTPGDYTIETAVCPRFLKAKDATHAEYKQKLKEHFTEVLKTCKEGAEDAPNAVARITLVREFDGMVKSYAAQGALQWQMENAKELSEKFTEFGKPKKATKKDKHADKLGEQIKDIQIHRGKGALKEDTERAVCTAFVTFEKIAYREKIMHEYRYSTNPMFRVCQSNRLKFHGHRLMVRAAPEPSDLNWENIDFDPYARIARRCCVCVSTLLVLMVCAALLVSIKTTTTSVPTVEYKTWVIQSPANDSCMSVCDWDLFASGICGQGGTSDAWTVTSMIDSENDHPVDFAAQWRNGSVYDCNTPLYTPQCSNRSGNYFAVSFAQKRPVKCMQLIQRALNATSRIKMFGCPRDIPAVGSRGDWIPDEHCVPMQHRDTSTTKDHPDHTGIVSGRLQVALDPVCPANISLEVANNAQAEGDSWMVNCFCMSQLQVDPGLMTPPYDTPVKQACEAWSIENGKKYGMLVVGILAVVILNQVLLLIFSIFIKFERLSTITAHTRSQLTKLFAAQFVNTGLLIYLVNAKFGSGVPEIFKVITEPLSLGKGSYYEANAAWFIAVGSSFIVTIISQVISTTITPLVMSSIVAPLLRKYAVWSGSLVKKELLIKLFEYPEWNLALRVAQSMNIICCVVFYSAGMPILYLVGALYCFMAYWLDKYCLLKGSKRPPAYNAGVIKMSISLTPLAAFLHTLFACSVLGNPTLFPSEFSLLQPFASGIFGITLEEYNDVRLRWESSSAAEQSDMWQEFMQARFLDFSRNGCWLLLLMFLFCCVVAIVYGLYCFLLEPIFGPCVRQFYASLRKCCGVKTQNALEVESDKTYQDWRKEKEDAKAVQILDYKIGSHPDYKAAAEEIRKQKDQKDVPEGTPRTFAQKIMGLFGLGGKAPAKSGEEQAADAAAAPSASPGSKPEGDVEAGADAASPANPEAAASPEAAAIPAAANDKEHVPEANMVTEQV